ncbi:MAG: hypothetical protein LJE84_13695, partial [Gammaproteobacteria bacterium]|nr:hypothetical protein [Gammaproteobacteria bacterium]
MNLFLSFKDLVARVRSALGGETSPQGGPVPIHLKDYRSPDFQIDHVDLLFDIQATHTDVRARLQVRRNGTHTRPLVLDGEQLELTDLRLNDRPVPPAEWQLAPGTLSVPVDGAQAQVEIHTRIRPRENTSLQGLYASGNGYFTQCEAQGFRRITYYPDRPDVMARFTTMILADRKRYPVLLSNGNRVDGGELPNHRHWVKWE